MNIPDLIDGFITWQSTLPCHANQETPFVDERVFQTRGVCGQAYPFLPSPPPPRNFLRSPQFSCIQEAKKLCFKPAESPTETLAMQASLMPENDPVESQFYLGDSVTVMEEQKISIGPHPEDIWTVQESWEVHFCLHVHVVQTGIHL